MTIDVQILDPTSSTPSTLPSAAGPNYVASQPTSKKYKITGDVNSNKIIGGNLDDTINGFGGNDSLYGLKGNDSLDGGDGHDYLDGGFGNDSLTGGSGNDTYVIDSSGDTINNSVPDDGTDLVQSSVAWALGSGQDNLALVGSSNINGTGNAADNTIIGNNGNNLLNGGGGNDNFAGSAGNDTYVIDSLGDTINGLDSGTTDLVVSSQSWTLGAHQENLTLTGINTITGTGNKSANHITGNNAKNNLIGNDGNDTLDGKGEADTLQGGKGSDLYIINHRDDIIIETARDSGNDNIQSWITYALGANLENLTLIGSGNTKGIGNYLNNNLIGNSGNNFLDGGEGRDTLNGGVGKNFLSGGGGDDYYFVNSGNDSLSESMAPSGYDIVESATNWTLQDNFESLIITGTANSASGNSLDNRIYAHTLGSATLSGGIGNDSYFVRSDAVTINETADQGTVDSVSSQ